MHRKPLSRARHVAGTPPMPTILFWTPEEAVGTPQMRLKGRERLPDQLAPHNTGCRDLIYSTLPDAHLGSAWTWCVTRRGWEWGSFGLGVSILNFGL